VHDTQACFMFGPYMKLYRTSVFNRPLEWNSSDSLTVRTVAVSARSGAPSLEDVVLRDDAAERQLPPHRRHLLDVVAEIALGVEQPFPSSAIRRGLPWKMHGHLRRRSRYHVCTALARSPVKGGTTNR